MNQYWTQPVDNPRPVDCPTCGEGVDINGPLENRHFVFAMRRARSAPEMIERSNLGRCPQEKGLEATIREMRYYLGITEVYYQGELY